MSETKEKVERLLSWAKHKKEREVPSTILTYWDGYVQALSDVLMVVE